MASMCPVMSLTSKESTPRFEESVTSEEEIDDVDITPEEEIENASRNESRYPRRYPRRDRRPTQRYGQNVYEQ